MALAKSSRINRTTNTILVNRDPRMAQMMRNSRWRMEFLPNKVSFCQIGKYETNLKTSE